MINKNIEMFLNNIKSA